MGTTQKKPDELVPDPKVAAELGVSLMTIWRYTNDPDLGFPPAIKIRKRNFRSRQALEEFKRRLQAEALSGRNRAA